MPENPNQPDPPASGDLPPERPASEQPPVVGTPADETLAAEAPAPPPRAEETVVLEEPVARTPREPGRFRQAASHRATPIVAAALAGLLVGGGVMALIAFTGDDDRDDRPARVEMFRGGHGFDGYGGFGPELRGPMRDGMRGEMPRWSPGLREDFPPRIDQLPIPDHRHDEDGNVIPAPRDGDDSGEQQAPEQQDQGGGN